MKSIPRLVGDEIPETSRTKEQKTLIVVKNYTDLENNRPIERLLPDQLMDWLGFVVLSNHDPQSTDVAYDQTDETTINNTKYPLGAIWINQSTSPNLIWKLTSSSGSGTSMVSTWTKQANTESPNLTGTPTSPTPAGSDFSTKIATAEFTQMAQHIAKYQDTMIVSGNASFDGTKFYRTGNIYFRVNTSLVSSGLVTVPVLTSGQTVLGINGTSSTTAGSSGELAITDGQTLFYNFSNGNFYICDADKLAANQIAMNDLVIASRSGNILALGNGLPLTAIDRIENGTYTSIQMSYQGTVILSYDDQSLPSANSIIVTINGVDYKVPASVNDSVIPVRCHTSCHSNCHSSCHGSCRSSW